LVLIGQINLHFIRYEHERKLYKISQIRLIKQNNGHINIKQVLFQTFFCGVWIKGKNRLCLYEVQYLYCR